jgi:chromosomal replication initiation ATPase DnaA
MAKTKNIDTPDVPIVDREFIDENSQIYRDLNIPLLLHCTIFKYKERIVIESLNAISSNLLSPHLNKLRDYFKQDVVITINASLEPLTESSIPGGGTGKKGSLYGRISAEYIETPYMVGKSNKFAFSLAKRFINSTEGAILFLYGESGTGKSHLLQKLANDLLEKGDNVFFTRGNDFVELIKSGYLSRGEEKSKKNSFLNNLKKYQLFVIDDFQYLYQQKLLNFIPDPLFEIIVQQLELGKLLAFSSDTPPTHANPHFHERIVNRLTSGLVCQLELPDIDMKRDYIDYFCKKNEFKVTREIEDYVMAIAKNLRTVKGILSYCHALNEQKELRIDKLVEITSKVYGGVAAVRKSTEQGTIEGVYALLKEYYGIPDEVIKNIEDNKKARKPKVLAMIDSITYYLLHKAVVDRDYLKKYLHIKYNTEKYCIKKGEESYKKIASGVKDEIGKILNMTVDKIKQQGDLWGQ